MVIRMKNEKKVNRISEFWKKKVGFVPRQPCLEYYHKKKQKQKQKQKQKKTKQNKIKQKTNKRTNNLQKRLFIFL